MKNAIAYPTYLLTTKSLVWKDNAWVKNEEVNEVTTLDELMTLLSIIEQDNSIIYASYRSISGGIHFVKDIPYQRAA